MFFLWKDVHRPSEGGGQLGEEGDDRDGRAPSHRQVRAEGSHLGITPPEMAVRLAAGTSGVRLMNPSTMRERLRPFYRSESCPYCRSRYAHRAARTIDGKENSYRFRSVRVSRCSRLQRLAISGVMLLPFTCAKSRHGGADCDTGVPRSGVIFDGGRPR